LPAFTPQSSDRKLRNLGPLRLPANMRGMPPLPKNLISNTNTCGAGNG
jgi:hypothetical protein